GYSRLRGSGRAGCVERGSGLWTGVGAASGAGLGSLSIWPLGMDCAMGMDVGGRRALGLCSVPLRPVGLRAKRLGLGSGACGGSAGVFAGAGGLGWRASV